MIVKLCWTYRSRNVKVELMKQKSGSKKPKAKVIRRKRTIAKPAKNKPLVPLPAAWER